MLRVHFTVFPFPLLPEPWGAFFFPSSFFFFWPSIMKISSGPEVKPTKVKPTQECSPPGFLTLQLPTFHLQQFIKIAV